MATQTGSYDFKAAKEAHDDAAQTSTKYITDFGDDGIKVHPDGDDSNYTAITSAGMDVYQDDSIVASFGRDGAQIGRVDSEHVDIGSGRVSMLNADGVPMFNADLDGGVVSYEAKLRSDSRVTKLPSNVNATGTTSWWTMSFNVQNVAVGTTFTLAAFATNPNGYTNLLDIEYSGTDSAIYFDVSNATFSQGLRLGTRNNHMTLLVDISAAALSLVAGTSESGTLEASGITWSTTSDKPNTLIVRFSYAYNADTGTLQCNTRYTIRTATGTATIASKYSEVTFWGLSILAQIATYAPAFTMGARTGDNGQFSAIVGEGLYATQDHQTALGKYNLEDTNDEYALIIGNGTGDADRSNAAVIDWLGNYIAQGWAGVIQMFAGSTPPAGWLLCDGSAVSRTTYATLYAAIGDTWGAGDGSTTFNLPDLRGRAPIGAGTGSGLTARSLAGKGGSENIQAHTHAFTQPKIPNHVHGNATTGQKFLTSSSNIAVNGTKRAYTSASDSGHYFVYGEDNSGINETANTGNPTSLADCTGGAVGAVSGATTGTAGNMQPFAVVNFIIHTGKTS